MLSGETPNASRNYGDGLRVISRRRVVSDLLEMVLEFFSLTGQTDLLISTNINISTNTTEESGQKAVNLSMSIHSASMQLLEQYRGPFRSLAGLCCTCTPPESRSSSKRGEGLLGLDKNERSTGAAVSFATTSLPPLLSSVDAGGGDIEDDDEEEI